MTMPPRPAHQVQRLGRQGDPAWVPEYEAILRAYEQAGGSPLFLQSPRIASLVISANRVLGANEVPGVHMEAEELPDGIRVCIVVEPETKLEQPIHLCSGMLPAEGRQRILAA